MGSTSVNLAIRCYGPPMIARAYQFADADFGDARDKLSRRLALAETVLHFSVAVMAPEFLGLGYEPPKELEDLTRKLHKPSLGDWHKAAEALARTLVREGGKVVARSIASMFSQRQGRRKKPVRTATSAALLYLLELRNKITHSDSGRIDLSEPEAERTLNSEEFRQSQNEMVSGLRTLDRIPIWIVKNRINDRRTGPRVNLLRFLGTEIESFDNLCGTQINVADNEPFVFSDQGHVIYLRPWIRVGEFSRGEPEARVLWRWTEDGCFYQWEDSRNKSPKFHDDDFPDRQSLLRAKDSLKPLALQSETLEDLLDASVERRDLPRIDGWRTLGLLGGGGSSEVYRVESEKDKTLAALKVLRLRPGQNLRERRRLKREFNFMRGLEHPGLAKVIDHGETANGCAYILLEFLAGPDLETRVAINGPLSPRQVGHIGKETLEALIAAHGHDIIHRDIKPSNLVFTSEGRVKIIDFGIAYQRDLPEITRTLDAPGTTHFAAPEQLRRAKIDQRADLYSLARTIEYLLSGALPGEPHDTAIPGGLQAILRRAGHRSPDARYDSAKDMLAEWEIARALSWQGAPAQEGDLLDESFAVGESLGTGKNGCWGFHGVELTLGRPVTIYVADGTSSGVDALRFRCQEAPGFNIVLRARDQLLYGVFPPSARSASQDLTIESLLHEPTPGPHLQKVRKALPEDGRTIPNILRGLSLGKVKLNGSSREELHFWTMRVAERMNRLAFGLESQMRPDKIQALNDLWKSRLENRLSDFVFRRDLPERLRLSSFRLMEYTNALETARNDLAHSTKAEFSENEIREIIDKIGASIQLFVFAVNERTLEPGPFVRRDENDHLAVLHITPHGVAASFSYEDLSQFGERPRGCTDSEFHEVFSITNGKDRLEFLEGCLDERVWELGQIAWKELLDFGLAEPRSDLDWDGSGHTGMGFSVGVANRPWLHIHIAYNDIAEYNQESMLAKMTEAGILCGGFRSRWGWRWFVLVGSVLQSCSRSEFEELTYEFGLKTRCLWLQDHAYLDHRSLEARLGKQERGFRAALLELDSREPQRWSGLPEDEVSSLDVLSRGDLGILLVAPHRRLSVRCAAKELIGSESSESGLSDLEELTATNWLVRVKLYHLWLWLRDIYALENVFFLDLSVGEMALELTKAHDVEETGLAGMDKLVDQFRDVQLWREDHKFPQETLGLIDALIEGEYETFGDLGCVDESTEFSGRTTRIRYRDFNYRLDLGAGELTPETSPAKTPGGLTTCLACLQKISGKGSWRWICKACGRAAKGSARTPRSRLSRRANRIEQISKLARFVDAVEKNEDVRGALKHLRAAITEMVRVHSPSFGNLRVLFAGRSVEFRRVGDKGLAKVVVSGWGEERPRLSLVYRPEDSDDLASRVKELKAIEAGLVRGEGEDAGSIHWDYEMSRMTAYALYHMLALDLERLGQFIDGLRERGGKG